MVIWRRRTLRDEACRFVPSPSAPSHDKMRGTAARVAPPSQQAPSTSYAGVKRSRDGSANNSETTASSEVNSCTQSPVASTAPAESNESELAALLRVAPPIRAFLRCPNGAKRRRPSQPDRSARNVTNDDHFKQQQQQQQQPPPPPQLTNQEFPWYADFASTAFLLCERRLASAWAASCVASTGAAGGASTHIGDSIGSNGSRAAVPAVVPSVPAAIPTISDSAKAEAEAKSEAEAAAARASSWSRPLSVRLSSCSSELRMRVVARALRCGDVDSARS
eukprot:6079574-Pleurochrysis_carterae.AAC.3